MHEEMTPALHARRCTGEAVIRPMLVSIFQQDGTAMIVVVVVSPKLRFWVLMLQQCSWQRVIVVGV